MNTNLALVTSQNFGNTACDFYQDKNDEQQEFYMTRDQIGTALEYGNPQKAIDKIHERHKERLDNFSVTVKLGATDGKAYNTTIYSPKGVYEICRWSRQAKADQFMDWVWDTIDKLRTGEYRLSQSNLTFSPQAIQAMLEQYLGSLRTELISDIDKRMNIISNSYLYLVKLAEQNTKPLLEIAPDWKRNMYAKANKIVEQSLDKFKDSKAVLQSVYTKMRNVYGIVWEQEQKDFKNKYDISGKVRTMELISDNEQLKSIFESILFDMADNIKSTEKVAEKSILEPVFIELDPIKAVIAPLIQKRQDKTKGGTNTYQQVYKRMGVCWSNRLSRYKNSHGLKKNPKKSLVIKENEKLFKLYLKVIAEMLNE